MGKYWKGPPDDRWYLYDDTRGQTKLIHRWREDYEQGTIHCPDCNVPLFFKDYSAKCAKCGEEFRSGFGQVYRVRAAGFHEKKYGRGWKSLRPYVGNK